MNKRTCTTRKAKHVVPKYLWYNSLLSPKPSSRESCKHHHPNPAAPTPHYASHRHRQPVLLTGSTQPRGERVGLAAVTRDFAFGSFGPPYARKRRGVASPRRPSFCGEAPSRGNKGDREDR